MIVVVCDLRTQNHKDSHCLVHRFGRRQGGIGRALAFGPVRRGVPGALGASRGCAVPRARTLVVGWIFREDLQYKFREFTFIYGYIEPVEPGYA